MNGEPKAILMVEFFAEDDLLLQRKAAAFIALLKEKALGYAHPVLYGADTAAA